MGLREVIRWVWWQGFAYFFTFIWFIIDINAEHVPYNTAVFVRRFRIRCFGNIQRIHCNLHKWGSMSINTSYYTTLIGFKIWVGTQRFNELRRDNWVGLLTSLLSSLSYSLFIFHFKQCVFVYCNYLIIIVIRSYSYLSFEKVLSRSSPCYHQCHQSPFSLVSFIISSVAFLFISTSKS